MAGSSEQHTENAGYTEDQKGLEWMFIPSTPTPPPPKEVFVT